MTRPNTTFTILIPPTYLKRVQFESNYIFDMINPSLTKLMTKSEIVWLEEGPDVVSYVLFYKNNVGTTDDSFR